MDTPGTIDISEMERDQLTKNGNKEQNKHHRSRRGRSWSFGSYSTITTVDETRDLSQHEQSASTTPSVLWGGGAPLEVNVPTIALVTKKTSSVFHHFGEMTNQSQCKTHSTPIDLDLMEDYYEYENSQNKTDTDEAKTFLVTREESYRPLIQNKNWLDPCREPEDQVQLPVRFTRFEI
jgi:hypothetical protein